MRIEDEPPLDIIDYLTIFFIVLVFAFSIYLVVDKLTPEKYEYQPREESVVRQTNIHYYPQFTVLASLAHLYPKDMRDTLTCESNWRHYNQYGGILRGKAGEYGLCQFMPETWKIYSKKSGLNGSILSAQDQLDLMEWMWERDLKEHWTCYRNL